MRCNNGRNCPYLNGEDIGGLIRERDYLRERVLQMEKTMGLAEQKIKELEEENKKLKEKNNELTYRIKKAMRKIFKPNVNKEEKEGV